MAQPRSTRVLVVDDDRLMRWSVAESLHDRGCDVVEAADARGAEAALHDGTELPRVVVLDLNLPDSVNLDLLSTIRREAPSARVVLMSAYMTPDIARDARDRGAVEVLFKPFELSTLVDVVTRAGDAP